MPDFSTNLPLICLDLVTFKTVVVGYAQEISDEELDPWINVKETMRLLNITSKTTLQKYRDSGQIEFKRLSKKNIIYRKRSVLNFKNSTTE